MSKIIEPVRNWMSEQMITAAPTMTLHEAMGVMKNKQVRHLPIIQDGVFQGIVAKSHIRQQQIKQAIQYNDNPIYVVTKQCTELHELPELIHLSVTPDDDMQDATRILFHHNISAVAVVVEEKLVGILTESDVYRYMLKNFFPEYL